MQSTLMVSYGGSISRPWSSVSTSTPRLKRSTSTPSWLRRISTPYSRLDLDALVDRVDMNAVLERVDIDALIEQTRVGSLVARSGGAAARRAVDHLRDHGIDLDMWVQRQVDRLLRRKVSNLPSGPPLLLHDLDQGSM